MLELFKRRIRGAISYLSDGEDPKTDMPKRDMTFVSIVAFGPRGSLASLPADTKRILSESVSCELDDTSIFVADIPTADKTAAMACRNRFHLLPHDHYDIVAYAPDGLQGPNRALVDAYLAKCFDEISKSATYAIMTQWGADGVEVIARSGEPNAHMPAVGLAAAQIKSLETIDDGPAELLRPGSGSFLGYGGGPSLCLYSVVEQSAYTLARTSMALRSARERVGHVATHEIGRDGVVIDAADGVVVDLDLNEVRIPQGDSPSP